MKKNKTDIRYKNFIQKDYLNKNKKIIKKYSDILKKITYNLDNDKDIFHSLSKKFTLNFKYQDLHKFRKFNTVVIIGMGGSILGSEAIYFFLKKKINKNFIFLNNIDEEKLENLKKQHKLDKTLFVIVSKSGNTIETLSNMGALKLIKNKRKNIIVISEKKDNFLFSLSKKMKYFHIEHKNYIGGRYSVLSEVGMVPAYLMGANITMLRKNLLFHLNSSNNKFLKESTIKLANILKKNKLKNIILFSYVPQLNKFLYWIQQLVGESLGKKGKGFLPVVSIAPKDHHSLIQLYLDGPKDKLIYVFSKKVKDKNKINIGKIDKKLNFLNDKSLGKIKEAQKKAFLKALKKKKIPHREFTINELNESSLGELFSYFILETAIVGKLVNINPFDQPAVEQVKINTKKLLA